jgi:UDP-glucose 4-epimerase
LRKVCGRELPVDYRPARRGEVHSTWCGISKAAREFGYAAPTRLADGLRSTWEWFEQNRAAWKCEAVAVFTD